MLPMQKDGSSARKAVVLDSVLAHAAQRKITDDEYAWMAKHCPDGSLPADGVFHQMRGGDDGWVYSYYVLDTPRGKREVWFYSGIQDK